VKAFRRTRDAPPEAAPFAYDPAGAFGLGTRLAEQGDVEGARSAFQQAIDSADPEYAPAAAFRLGLLLGRRGDIEGTLRPRGRPPGTWPTWDFYPERAGDFTPS